MASVVISSPSDMRRFFSTRSSEALPAGEYMVSVKNSQGYTDRFDRLTVLSDGTIKTGSGFVGNPVDWAERLLRAGFTAQIDGELSKKTDEQDKSGLSTTMMLAIGGVAALALILFLRNR